MFLQSDLLPPFSQKEAISTLGQGPLNKGPSQSVELKLRWPFFVQTSTCSEIYF